MAIGDWRIALCIIFIPFADHLLSENIKAKRESKPLKMGTLSLATQLSIKYYAAAVGWTIFTFASQDFDTHCWTGFLGASLISGLGSMLFLWKAGEAIELAMGKPFDSVTTINRETGHWQSAMQNKKPCFFAKDTDITTESANERPADHSMTTGPRTELLGETRAEMREGRAQTTPLRGTDANTAAGRLKLLINQRCGFETRVGNCDVRINLGGNASVRLALTGLLEGTAWRMISVLCAQSEVDPTLSAVLVGLATSPLFCLGYATPPGFDEAIAEDPDARAALSDIRQVNPHRLGQRATRIDDSHTVDDTLRQRHESPSLA